MATRRSGRAARLPPDLRRAPCEVDQRAAPRRVGDRRRGRRRRPASPLRNPPWARHLPLRRRIRGLETPPLGLGAEHAPALFRRREVGEVEGHHAQGGHGPDGRRAWRRRVFELLALQLRRHLVDCQDGLILKHHLVVVHATARRPRRRGRCRRRCDHRHVLVLVVGQPAPRPHGRRRGRPSGEVVMRDIVVPRLLILQMLLVHLGHILLDKSRRHVVHDALAE
mmetsp:Transcript_108443/g.313306  ORF Transcript_108443/g.313306 Transcript_108443/m.313306 type:complete len:224 (+) Transcript_108443:82-753(+)